MKENKKYMGEFIITHGLSTTTFEISVEDVLSRTRFIEFSMSAEDLMLALTGQGNMKCEFELRGLELIGKEHQNRDVTIPEITTHLSDKEFLKVIEQVRPHYEVDGWRMDEQKHFNMHMLQGLSLRKGDPVGYRVILRRYVDVE